MGEFTISLIKSETEVCAALEFINGIAFQRHGARPPPPPQTLFAAYCDGAIVGTIGLEFSINDQPLPVENHWLFDGEKTPLPFRRSEIVEIGRWMATKPGVSAALFYAATIFSLSHGKHCCIAEMKSKIAQHSTALGFIMLPVRGAKIVLENISKDGLAYYLKDPPALYMLSVEQMHQSIRRVTPSLQGASLSFLI